MIDQTDLDSVSRNDSGVRLERTFAADPDRVWLAWTDPQRLGRWLAPIERGAPGPGAEFVLRMDTHETATCTVTRWDPPSFLEMRWDYTGESTSCLRLQILARPGGGTRLVIEHDRLAATAGQIDYAAGWHTHLAGLRAHLLGEPAPDFTRTIRAAHQALGPRFAAPTSTEPSAAERQGADGVR